MLAPIVLTPEQSPVTSPEISTPVDQSQSPIEAPSAELGANPPVVAVEVVVPAVVVSVSAAVGLFLLIFLLNRRKKKQDKKGKNNDDDKGQMLSVYGHIASADNTHMTDRTIRDNYNMVPSQDNGEGYTIRPNSANPAPSMTGVKPDEDILNPYAIKSTEIEKRMHIPYGSLAFVKELGAGSYGKVYLGYGT